MATYGNITLEYYDASGFKITNTTNVPLYDYYSSWSTIQPNDYELIAYRTGGIRRLCLTNYDSTTTIVFIESPSNTTANMVNFYFMNGDDNDNPVISRLSYTVSSASFKRNINVMLSAGSAGPSTLNFKVYPNGSQGVSSVSLQSPTGESDIVFPDGVNMQTLSWPVANGDATLNIGVQQASLSLGPQVPVTEPNVTTKFYVQRGGNTTEYTMGTNIPDQMINAGENVSVRVKSTAPTVTVDYTNTTEPVITNTPIA